MKKILLLSILTIFLYSCSDSRSEGCIEPAAINYESFADYDDGSCYYSSDVVFYEDVAAAVYFDLLDVEWLDLTVEGEYIGTLDATLGLTYVPNCNEIDAVVFSLEWDNASHSSFSWTIRDETGFKHYEGVETIYANESLPMELTWKKIQVYKEATK